MKPVPFHEQNCVIGENQQGVAPLPAFADGQHVVSCWELSPEEKRQVLLTGRIYVLVCSPRTPPINLFTDSPFLYEARASDLNFGTENPSTKNGE
jgi:hypothetical protein